jgi:hypothetical protein
VDDLVFGTDNLQDDAAKITKIYLRAKGTSRDKDDFRATRVSCLDIDISILKFFKKHEGNKRLAATALLCAGLSRVQKKLSEFPVSIDAISEVFARIKCIREINWAFDYTASLDPYSYVTTGSIKKAMYIEIPEELWGMIYGISEGLMYSFPNFVLYLLRLGILEYNNFIKRFSRMICTIPSEFSELASEWEKMFMESIDFVYDISFHQIKKLQIKCSEVEGHEDLKEEVKRIIDKYI